MCTRQVVNQHLWSRYPPEPLTEEEERIARHFQEKERIDQVWHALPQQSAACPAHAGLEGGSAYFEASYQILMIDAAAKI